MDSHESSTEATAESKDNGMTSTRTEEKTDKSDGATDKATKARVGTVEGRCDICQNPDGFWGHRLLRCKACGVCVHELCIGKTVSERSDDDSDGWTCSACLAVGTRIVTRTSRGRPAKTLVQHARPRECALCSVDTGTHHMYPLYDTHGRKGVHLALKQDVKKGLPMRPAWVHTLCAQFVGYKTGGVVYACDKDGSYFGDEGNESEDETMSESEGSCCSNGSSHSAPNENGPKKKDADADADDNDDDDDGSNDDYELSDIHHFVIAGKEKGEETPWTRIIEKHRKMKCIFCGAYDNLGNSTRIPVECSVGSETEYQGFKKRHLPMICTQPMHVGCARWSPHGARVYFYPGLQEGDKGNHNELIVECYCTTHAKELLNNSVSGAGEAKRRGGNSSKKKKKREEESRALTTRDGLVRRRAVAGTLGPRTGSSSAPAVASPSPSLPPPPRSKRGRDGEEGGIIGRDDQPPWKKRYESGGGGKVKYRDLFILIRNDVVSKLRSAIEDGRDGREVMSECKAHWREDAELPKEEFKNVWTDVKAACRKIFYKEASSGTTTDGR